MDTFVNIQKSVLRRLEMSGRAGRSGGEKVGLLFSNSYKIENKVFRYFHHQVAWKIQLLERFMYINI